MGLAPPATAAGGGDQSTVVARSYGAELASRSHVEVIPLKLKLRRGGGHPGVVDDFVSRCPLGTVLTPFDMPIYDEEGLFIVDYETVWYCLPDDLEPAG